MVSGGWRRLKMTLISVAVTQSWRTRLVSNSDAEGRPSKVLKAVRDAMLPSLPGECNSNDNLK